MAALATARYRVEFKLLSKFGTAEPNEDQTAYVEIGETSNHVTTFADIPKIVAIARGLKECCLLITSVTLARVEFKET